MYQKLILIGNTGKDPEIIDLRGGNILAKTSLATSRRYKDKQGQKQEETEWFNLVFFGSLADIVEKYVKKGDKLQVEGRLKTRSWETDRGERKYATEVIVEGMNMLGGQAQGQPASRSTRSSHPNKPEDLGHPPLEGAQRVEEEDDDLPF